MDGHQGSATGLIVIGSSAGGLHALIQLLGQLPPLPVPVIIVQHMDPGHRSMLERILASRIVMPVVSASHGLQLRPGVVHLAIPDEHLRVNGRNQLLLDHELPVNFVRPSIDHLLESVAAHYGPDAIAVVLTGTGRDGAAGIEAVHDTGGRVLVQQDAEFDGMPNAAVATGCVDESLPLDKLALRLVELTGGAPPSGPIPAVM